MPDSEVENAPSIPTAADQLAHGKADRTAAVAQNFIWREKNVGKDGVALEDGTMTRTTPQVRRKGASRRRSLRLRYVIS